MAIPRQGINFSGGNYIKTVYSKRLIEKFYAASVCTYICNGNWTGEITGQGNKVELRERPDLEVDFYAVGEPIHWQDVVPVGQELTIDYSLVSAFKESRVDLHQTDVNWQSELLDEIAQRLRIGIETVVLGSAYSYAGAIVSGAGGTNSSDGTAGLPWGAAGNSLKVIGKCEAQLGWNNAPRSERWFLLSPSMVNLLKQENALFALNSGQPKGAMLESGFVCNLFGFDFYESSLVPGLGTNSSPYLAMAGHISAITLAPQFLNFEANIQLNDYLEVGMRAQNCFGFKVVKAPVLIYVPTSLASS